LAIVGGSYSTAADSSWVEKPEVNFSPLSMLLGINNHFNSGGLVVVLPPSLEKLVIEDPKADVFDFLAKLVLTSRRFVP
jgi:hypothetical protein